MKRLIPDLIAPTPADTESIRTQNLIAMCDYWEWYVQVRVDAANRAVARIEYIVARLRSRGTEA